jgi:hypothetical protein
MTTGSEMSDYPYKYGDAEWDTGLCSVCGNELTATERRQACINMFHNGFLYQCTTCTDTSLKSWRQYLEKKA